MVRSCNSNKTRTIYLRKLHNSAFVRNISCRVLNLWIPICTLRIPRNKFLQSFSVFFGERDTKAALPYLWKCSFLFRPYTFIFITSLFSFRRLRYQYPVYLLRIKTTDQSSRFLSCSTSLFSINSSKVINCIVIWIHGWCVLIIFNVSRISRAIIESTRCHAINN